MSKLQLLLLGHFEFLLPSGERISLSMRKAEVLLAYLALAPGIRHPRERLINLLWSDRGEEQARNSLRQCLSAIKKSLGDVADLVIQVDRTSVCLKPEMIDIDAHQFERLATDAEFESLSDAAALYRGEFLEGISIRDAASQEWLDSERSRFKRQYIEILTNLGHTLLASHEHNGAIKTTERLVAEDTLGESGWRLLMRAYSANGDRSHALQAFKRCQQALRSELDVEPETATVELRNQIANNQTKLASMPLRDSAVQEFVAVSSSASTDAKVPVDESQASGHRIAVLPFDNLSGDPEQEYFSDGITDSIILNLSMFPELQVKSRNSSFAFKQQIKSLGEISQELNVDYVVEGSIRKSRDRVRVTVQLIEAFNGNQIWGKRYDADIENLFDLEEELSRSIAATVTGQIESDLQRIALAKGAAGHHSYDLLLAGTYHSYRFNRNDNVIAIEKLNQCLQQDPDNIRAHALLYSCHGMDFLERWTRDYQSSFELAGTHARRALELGPELSAVQACYAEYLIFAEQLEKASKHLDKALKINPNDPYALTTRALCLIVQGDFANALKTAKHTCQLDPYHPWAEWELAGSQYLSGLYETALETIENFRTDPGFTQVFAIACLVKLDKTEPARQALQVLLRNCREHMLSMPQNIDEWKIYIRSCYPFTNHHHNQDLIDCLVQAGLEEFLDSPAQPDAETLHNIAVLPFDNLSGDPRQEYFSDGISESIILHLNMFPGLIVKSRNSSFAFKQQIKGLGEISAELGVDYLVEGSLRKSVDKIRITVQLVEAASGNQVWGKRYDGALSDLFELEEQLSRSIAATVTGQIDDDLRRIALTKGAAEQQAYDFLLAGAYHLARFTAQDNAIAIERFNQCLEQDPDNARAHAQLCGAHNMDMLERWSSDYRESSKRAQEHIYRAIELDPGLGIVQTFYAEQLTFNGQFDQADKHLDKALSINPNDPEPFAVRAAKHISTGDFAAAIETATHAFNLDPYHPWAEWELAAAQYFSNSYEAALETIAGARTSPGFEAIFAIAANIKLGQSDTARQILQDFLQQCRETMKSMPCNLEEWYDYTRCYYLCADSRYNQDLIDCMVQAGLKDKLDASTGSAEPSDYPSILVLPFGNLSGDTEQDYFSDGITESIIVTLSASSGLKVKSRHTSFAYRDSLLSLDQIGAKLEVQYIVEGSIRKHGDQVRITIQLSETASGNQVWGKRYDRPLAELFSLEEELVQTIAGSISGRIGHNIRISAKQRPANNPKSYDYLMRGWYHGERFTPDDNRAALENFSKCVELEPGNAHAHSLIAATFNVQRYEYWCADCEAASAKAEQHINRALEYEPDNALAHSFMAEHLLFERKYEQALFHCEQAIELEPGLPDGYGMKGFTLCLMGRIDEAVALAEQSLRMDPYHFYMGWNAGGVFRTAGAYQKAIDTYRLIPVPPPSLHAEIAACLVGLGEIAAARTAMTEYLRLSREQMPDYPTTEAAWRQVWVDSYNYHLDSDFEPFWKQLLAAGLCDNLELPFDAIPVVAVLPFQNLSSDKEQEYFSDGITSSLIMSMGQFHGLNVRPQNSSFALRNSEKSSKEIAQELAADFLIEGSIRKSGSKVRIAVQLVEAETDTQIWGKQYDAELVDILDLEQELSATIASTISGRIGHRIQQSAVRKPATNLKSYDYLLRGLYHMGKFTAADMEIAQQQIEKCIALDPDNAEAHIQLGMVHTLLRYENWTSDRQQTLESEGKHLIRALELAPDNALVHAYYAEHLLSKRDYELSEFHVNKAIELNPTAAEGYTVKADLMGFTRRYDEALNLADQCFRLDPNGVGTGWVAGDVYRITGNYEKAIRTLRSISHPPATIHALIAASFVGLGQLDKAKAEMAVFLKRAHTEMPNKPDSRAAWRKLYKQSSQYKYEEDFEELFSMLLQAGLCDEPAEGQDEIPSIAVLPFENMSDDPEQAFFSDGITADIISTLSKFKHMRIVARHSTEAYREKKSSIADIASEQGVRYILEGSVRRSGKRIRVSAELIDSQSEQICWSERYDRDLDDLFAVQDELTREIALAMKVQLDDGDMARHRSAGTSNIKAWELTMTAVDLQDTYIQQNIVEARSMARQALALDPEYVFAHVVLAWTFWQDVYGGWSEDPEKSLIDSETSSQLALQLDPDNADALAQAGTGYVMRHNTDKAMEYSRRAIELEPGNAENQALRAFACIFAGDYEQARVHEQNMRRLCPVLPNWYYLILGQIEQLDGNLDEAISIYQQGIAVEPDSTLCRFYLIHALMLKGDTNAAQKFADEILALDSNANGGGLARAISKDAAIRDQFLQYLTQFGLARPMT